MRIFAISDLHLSTVSDKPMDIFGTNWTNHFEKIKTDWQNKVACDDIVLLAGDFSWAMNLNEALYDFDLLKNLNGTKIMIRGNHDYWWSGISKIRDAVPENFFMLQNDSIKFGDYVICGTRGWSTPGCPDFDAADEKIYYREAERLKMSLNSAKKLKKDGDKLICLMHYPPFNAKRENSLFTEILEKNNVDKVVYGHLHGKESRTSLNLVRNGIEYYLTSCDILDFKLIEIK